MSCEEHYYSLAGLSDHLASGGWVKHASWTDFCIRTVQGQWVGFYGPDCRPSLRAYNMPPKLVCSRCWSPCDDPTANLTPPKVVIRGATSNPCCSFVPPFWAPPVNTPPKVRDSLNWEEALEAYANGEIIERLTPDGFCRRLTPRRGVALSAEDLTATNWRVVS